MNSRITSSSSQATQVSAAPLLARAKRALAGLAAAALIWTGSMAAAPSPAVSEYAVKAAVLFKVAKFVEWPTGTFDNEHSTFVVCVVGRQAPLPAFESLKNNHLGARPLDVRLVTGDMLDLRQCQIAFFPTNSDADVAYALSKLEGMAVLTVGESEEFAKRGGTLALVTRDQRVGFTVNLSASKRSNLTISSQLLSLATVIEGGKR